MSSVIDSETQKSFLKNLLQWYKKHGRHDMPWRNTKDPYAIFVSEFMLQQTTVSTVKPYYERFLKRFPTIKSLAESELNDVLALWSGLGYYARARNLWASMHDIVEEHKGKIPSDLDTLQKLPGVGFYTSGAISSLAFNKPAPVLDGNIIRVLMRVLALEEDPKLKAVQVILRKVSIDLANIVYQSKSRAALGPRALVLALMDLGATVCTPRNPDCEACPVSSLCLAKSYGKQDSIPYREEKESVPTVKRLFAIIESENKFLLGQRPAEGLFGGLWEFIGTDLLTPEEPIPFLEKLVKAETGFTVRVQEALPSFEHQLTHKTYIVRAYRCRQHLPKLVSLPEKGETYVKFKWVSQKDMSKLGISAITKRILNEISLIK